MATMGIDSQHQLPMPVLGFVSGPDRNAPGEIAVVPLDGQAAETVATSLEGGGTVNLPESGERGDEIVDTTRSVRCETTPMRHDCLQVE